MNMNDKSTRLFYFVAIILLIIPIASFLNQFVNNSAFAQSPANNTIAPSTAFTAPVKTISKFLTYSNPSYGIKIQFPSDWKVSRNGLRDYNDVVAFYAPIENISDIFPEHVTLSRTDYLQNISLVQYGISINKTLNVPGIHILQSTAITLSDNPAHEIVFSITPPKMGIVLQNMLIYTIKNNKVYVILYNAEASKYSTYLPIVQRMIQSFKILNSFAPGL
jgi:eukaryotic-like serine/threonine-protein kinase